MEREYIKRCLELVVKKLQWGDSVDWTNSDFINLSKIIYEKTNISISHATLKRVFGKQKTDSKEQYNPQIDTKDALVKLIGYKDWIDFKDKIDVSDAEEVSHRKKNSSTFITRRKVINAILFLLLIGLIFLIYYHQTNIVNKKKILSKISFSINKTEGDVPLNIVINYD